MQKSLFLFKKQGHMTEHGPKTLKMAQNLVATFMQEKKPEDRAEALTELVETLLNEELEKCKILSPRKKLHEIVEKLVLHFINENEWPAATPHDTMVRDVEDFVRGELLKRLHAGNKFKPDVLQVYRNSEFTRDPTDEFHEYMRCVIEQVQKSLYAAQKRRERDNERKRAARRLKKEPKQIDNEPLEAEHPNEPVGPDLARVMSMPNLRNMIVDLLTAEQAKQLAATSRRMTSVNKNPFRV